MKNVAAVLISVLAFVAPVKAQSTHSTAVVLSENTSQQQIDAQVKQLRLLRQQSYAGSKCSDENLAHDQSAYCFNVVTGKNPYGPVGASDGGD
jgi:hypothetical protein